MTLTFTSVYIRFLCRFTKDLQEIPAVVDWTRSMRVCIYVALPQLPASTIQKLNEVVFVGIRV